MPEGACRLTIQDVIRLTQEKKHSTRLNLNDSMLLCDYVTMYIYTHIYTYTYACIHVYLYIYIYIIYIDRPRPFGIPARRVHLAIAHLSIHVHHTARGQSVVQDHGA